tara:strand:+ start:3210 stop:4736 length:1527 start_codon:yes stop_codon:yes gene_type:complete
MSDDSRLMKNVLKGVGFLFLGIIFSKLFNYVFRIIIARYLGPGDYGLFSLALAVVGVLVTLSLLGLPQGIVRYVAQYKARQDSKRLNGVIVTSMKLSVFMSLIFSILLYIFAESVAVILFSKPEMLGLLQLMAVAIPLTVIITNLEKVVLAFQRVEYITISRNFSENLVKVILSIIFVSLGFGIVWVASAYLFSIFVGIVLLFYFLHNKVHRLSSVIRNRVSVSKKLLRFSLPLLFTDVFTFLLVWTDTLILGYFVTSADIGIYNAAVPTAMLVYMVPTTLRTMFYPVMSEYYSLGRNVKAFYQRVSDWLLFLTLPVAAFLVMFREEFLGFFFGDVYVEGATVLMVICLAYFVYALANTPHIMLYVKKKTKLIMFNTVVAVLVNIGLNLYLIPRYGLLGAALATGIALIVRSLLIFAEGLYFMKVLPFTFRSFYPFVALILPVIIFTYFQAWVSNILFLILASLLFALLYGSVLLVMKYFDKEDSEILDSVERKLPFSLQWLRKIMRV